MTDTAPSDTTLYHGGAIFDGHERRDGHALLTRGATIEALAPLAAFDGYAGARVELSGQTLLPGLIDCHVHLCYGGEPNAAALLRLDDRGRLAAGAAADLLVVAGDPLDDIDAAADVANHRRVVKNGRVVDVAELRGEIF